MITNRNLSVLFDGCKPKDFPKGEVIISEGDSVDKLYFVQSGYVKVYTLVGHGTQRVAFIYKEGEIFPVTTYLSSSNVARFFYECLTPSRLRILKSRKFEKKVKDNLIIGEEILQYTRSVDQLFLERVHELVADEGGTSKLIKALRFLIERAGSSQDKAHIDLPMSSRFLASVCGLSLEETNTHLATFKDKGILSKTHSTVIDTTKLEALGQEIWQG